MNNKKILPGLYICLFSSLLTGCNTSNKPSTSSHTETNQSSKTAEKSSESNGKDNRSLQIEKNSKKEDRKNQKTSETSSESNGEDASTNPDKNITDESSKKPKKPEEILEDVKENSKTIKRTLEVSDEMLTHIKKSFDFIRSQNSRKDKNTQNKEINKWINGDKCKNSMEDYSHYLQKAKEANTMLLKDSTIIVTGDGTDNLKLLIDESKADFEIIENNDKEIQELIKPIV